MADADYYFASPPSPDALCRSVAQRVTDVASECSYADDALVFEHLFDSSLRWGSQNEVMRAGDAGELVKLRAAKIKALLKSWVGLMLGAPKTWRPSARTDDVESRAAVKKTADLLEAFWKDRGLEVFCGEAGEAAGAFKVVFALPTWDRTKGQPEAVEESGNLVWGGGLTIRLVQKWDVFWDKQYRSWEDVPWVCVRTWENRHDLLALESDEARKSAIRTADDGWLKSVGMKGAKQTGKDVVPVFNFFHRPSPAVPDGMQFRFLSAEVQLSPAEPCNEIPLERLALGTRPDSTEGDSQWTSTMGLQQMYDSVNSSIASNLDAFATQSIEMPADMMVSKDKTLNLTVFERPKGVPPGLVQPVQLVRQPEGVDKVLEMWARDMMDLCGLNDVAMGSPDSAQMNAAAFAILKGAATERNSLPQRRLLDFVGRLGARVLRLLSENMSEEELIAVAGRGAKRGYPSRDLTRSQLGLIESVYVEVGNALEQSIEGRMQITQMALDAGAIKDPRDLLSALQTGRLPESIDRANDEANHIEWENDEILAGRVPTVYFTHDHLAHGGGHACVGLNPLALSTEPTLKALKAHIDWHYTQYWGLPEGTSPETDPLYADRLRILLGQQAPGQVGPPPMGPMAPPPAGGASSTATPPAQGASDVAPPSAGAPPALSAPEEIPGEAVPSVVPN